MRILLTYAAVEAAMDQVVQRAFYEGRFLTTLQAGAYTFAQVRHFALQYSFYSRHFPRVLGAAVAAMPPDDRWWIPIADNLWDEAGRGIAGRSHAVLYRSFLQSVDPKLQFEADGTPVGVLPSSAVLGAIDTFLDVLRTAEPVAAMAAVGLGSEYFAGEVMGAIAAGLRHPQYNAVHPLDLTFWDVHAGRHEPRHYALCKEVLVTYHDPQTLRLMFEVGQQIALSEARMYDQLHDEMIALK